MNNYEDSQRNIPVRNIDSGARENENTWRFAEYLYEEFWPNWGQEKEPLKYQSRHLRYRFYDKANEIFSRIFPIGVWNEKTLRDSSQR